MTSRINDDEWMRFDDLVVAMKTGQIALARTTRKSDGKEVAVICMTSMEGVHEDNDIEVKVIPMAVLFDDEDFNAYELPITLGDE